MTLDAWKPVSPVQCPWCGCKEFETRPLYASDGLEWYTCKGCELRWSDYDTWDIVNRWRRLEKKLRECVPEFDEMDNCKLCGFPKEDHILATRTLEKIENSKFQEQIEGLKERVRGLESKVRDE